METTSRVYGGADAEERRAERRSRLLASGLDLLGTGGFPALTVRGVAAHSGLGSRYFYESFADVEALAIAVFDGLVEELVEAGIVALAAAAPADLRSSLRATIRAAVDLVADDPRKGRVLLSLPMASPALAQRRLARGDRIAAMVADQFRDHLPEGPQRNERQLLAMARFMVGGLSEVLTAWMSEPGSATREETIDDCVDLFLAVTATLRWRSPNAAPAGSRQ